jgi:LysR family glycine cleavage system transcriptional activator
MSPWPHLPALRTLRAFEAAARHLNYTHAAAELHQTHGAISHQMRALEADLGVPLFERTGKQTRLTDAGQQLALGVRAALDALAAVVGRVREGDNGRKLTVSVLPSFAAAWLIKRLGEFMERHPQIELNLRSTTALADFRSDGVDVAIRYSRGPWPDLVNERLMGDELFPVLSPDFRQGPWPQTPADLLKLPLLRVRGHPWAPWFRAVGIEAAEPTTGASFDDSELVLQAVMQGQGVALARSSLAGSRVKAGTLIAPFATRVVSPSSYFLVYPQATAQKVGFKLFRAWLLEELGV